MKATTKKNPKTPFWPVHETLNYAFIDRIEI